MKRHVLRTVWCYVSGAAAGEIRNCSLLGVKGVMLRPVAPRVWLVLFESVEQTTQNKCLLNWSWPAYSSSHPISSKRLNTGAFNNVTVLFQHCSEYSNNVTVLFQHCSEYSNNVTVLFQHCSEYSSERHFSSRGGHGNQKGLLRYLSAARKVRSIVRAATPRIYAFLPCGHLDIESVLSNKMPNSRHFPQLVFTSVKRQHLAQGIRSLPQYLPIRSFTAEVEPKRNGACTREEIYPRRSPSYMTMATNADQRKWRQVHIAAVSR